MIKPVAPPGRYTRPKRIRTAKDRALAALANYCTADGIEIPTTVDEARASVTGVVRRELDKIATRGLFVTSNGLAPEGYVEIQRSDDSDDALEGDPPGPRFPSDEDAALEVERLAGCPGAALRYAIDGMIFVRARASSDTSPPAYGAEIFDTREDDREYYGHSDDRGEPSCPRWIVVVPEYVARAAGCRFNPSDVGGPDIADENATAREASENEAATLLREAEALFADAAPADRAALVARIRKAISR